MTIEGTYSEQKKAWVNNWGQIDGHLPEDFNSHYEEFVWQYFRAQLRIARGQMVKAGRIMDDLDGQPGFREFEEKNESLLAAIEIAVRGKTNRRVEPLFRLD